MVLPNPLYITNYGMAYVGDSLLLLDQLEDNSIDLVLTSPPFALQRQKTYGNVDQEEYVDWLVEFCKKVHRVLAPTGSFVIDLGGAYQSKRPVRSLYNYRILIKLCDELTSQRFAIALLGPAKRIAYLTTPPLPHPFIASHQPFIAD